MYNLSLKWKNYIYRGDKLLDMISRILILNKDTLDKLKKIKKIEKRSVNEICRTEIKKYLREE